MVGYALLASDMRPRPVQRKQIAARNQINACDQRFSIVCTCTHSHFGAFREMKSQNERTNDHTWSDPIIRFFVLIPLPSLPAFLFDSFVCFNYYQANILTIIPLDHLLLLFLFFFSSSSFSSSLTFTSLRWSVTLHARPAYASTRSLVHSFDQLCFLVSFHCLLNIRRQHSDATFNQK